MEVYILDSLLRRVEVIDQFESLIWTERFNAFGDFQLVIQSTLQNRTRLKPGVRLAMNESYRVMTVETVVDGEDEDGKQILEVSGNSLESLLLDRLAKDTLTNPNPWVINGTPAAVARWIFRQICFDGILDPLDKIPYLTIGSFLPAMPTSNIAEPVDPIIANVQPKSVYEAIKEICDVWTLGFRLLRQDNPAGLYWDVYAGRNLTSGQTLLKPVIFAPELDNLTNTKELNSIESSKNVAYVVALNGALVVYPQDLPPDTDGFDRRVLYVDASDITLPYGTAPSGVPDTARTAFIAALTQRGKEELAKNRPLQAFDGEINPNSLYQYQRDYFLGDLVEQRNRDGMANQMRVTEQIFVSDKEGPRRYPTLTLNTFVNTGSWLSLGTKQWADFTTEEWAQLP
jgi:hypothetical protein